MLLFLACIYSSYLLGRHGLAIEAYLEAENVSSKPDWVIYHNLGMDLVYTFPSFLWVISSLCDGGT